VNKPEAIVFVVDDDPSFRRSVERLLRMAGYKVQSLASAMEFLNSGRPDATACLVTDLRMPELNGLDLQQDLARSSEQGYRRKARWPDYRSSEPLQCLRRYRASGI
jgi:FixJ family two-component response regulator